MCIECLFIHYPCPRSSIRCDQVLFLFTLISHNLQGGLDRNESTLEFFRVYPYHILSRNYHRSVFSIFLHIIHVKHLPGNLISLVSSRF